MVSNILRWSANGLLVLLLSVDPCDHLVPPRGVDPRNRHARRTGAADRPSGADAFRRRVRAGEGSGGWHSRRAVSRHGGVERAMAAYQRRAGRGRLSRHRPRSPAVWILGSSRQLHAAGPGRPGQRRARCAEGRARHHRRSFLRRRCSDRTRDAISGSGAGAGAGRCGARIDGAAVSRALGDPAAMDSRNPGVADHHQSGGDENAAQIADREEGARAAGICRDPATAD